MTNTKKAYEILDNLRDQLAAWVAANKDKEDFAAKYEAKSNQLSTLFHTISVLEEAVVLQQIEAKKYSDLANHLTHELRNELQNNSAKARHESKYKRLFLKHVKHKEIIKSLVDFRRNCPNHFWGFLGKKDTQEHIRNLAIVSAKTKWPELY